jgi:predicted Zn-dependent peptidase
LNTFFEGTENIKRGEWFKIVTGNGGTNNANTSDDRTYYYEFPSNNLELGLWMEAERMLHPYNQIGVDTQNEVVRRKDYVLTTLLTDKFCLK